MVMKLKPNEPAKKCVPNHFEVTKHPAGDDEAIKARNVIDPTVKGALATAAFCKAYGELDLQSLVTELGNQCERVRGGNLGQAERLLTTHAHTLDAIFNELARRAAMNMGEYIKATDTYLRLALKA